MTTIPAVLGPMLAAGLFVWFAAAAPGPHPQLALAADSCLFGRIDDFLYLADEPAAPHVHLVPVLMGNTTPPLLEFDECTVNRYFAHTIFSCLGTDSMKLHLTIRLKANGTLSTTDILYLGTEGQMRWGLRMNAVGALFGTGPSWDSGDTATVVLDLAHLPPSDAVPGYGPDYPAGVTDVLQWVRYHNNLDIIVADDTCVDYIALTLAPGGTTPTLPTSWGSLKRRYR